MKTRYIIPALALLAVACVEEVEKPQPKTSDPSKAPQVVSTTPAINATDADATDEIVITYDKAILLATNTTISVNGIYCDGDVYTADKDLIIPFEVKGGGLTYTVSVKSPSVKDSEGNFSQDFTFSFTTRTANKFNAAEFNLAEAPVDPSITPEAKALYDAMKANFGSKVYSAAMAEVTWNYDNAAAIQAATGKYPAINAFDYIHLYNSGAPGWADYSDITPVKNWSDMGGIVAAGWHWMVPVSDPSSGSGPVTPDPEYTEEVIFNQDLVCPTDWSGYKYFEPSYFVKLALGCKIVVYYKNANGALMALKNPISGWPGLVDDEGNSYEYFDIPNGSGFYSLTVDNQILADVKANGLVVGGRDYTMTKLSIFYPGGGGVPEDVVIDINVDCPDDWSGYKVLEAGYFTSCTVGTQLIIAYTNASGAQMGLKNPIAGWPGYVDEQENDYSYFNIPDGDGAYTLTLDATLVAGLKANGLIIGGHDYHIVSLTIHYQKAAAAPRRAGLRYAPATNVDYGFYSQNNEFNPVDALTDGHWQNKVLNNDLDSLVNCLKLIQDQNIPVLWRPLHEASGGWFWWGSRTGADFVALWQYVYNYITAAGVHNLLWVWTSCLDDADWYPGDGYVDFIAYDWYPQNELMYHSSNREAWDNLLEISNKKMLTLGECGAIPNINACLEDGAMWSWWMPWYGDFMKDPYNSTSDFSAWMGSPYVLTMEDIK